VTRRWGKKVEPDTITALRPYNYVMSVTLADGRTDPFRVRGASVEELYEDYHRPDDLPKLSASVDQNLRRRPVRDILDDLRRLDNRIMRALASIQVQPDDDDDVPRGRDEERVADDTEAPVEEGPESGRVRISKDPGTVISGPHDEEPPYDEEEPPYDEDDDPAGGSVVV